MYQVMRTMCDGSAPASCSTATMLRRACAGLRDEVVALELLLRIPADLAADEDLGAAGGDAIGISLGRRPSGRLQEFHGVFSLKRCSLPVSVRGSLATNSISRGYLYGAMLAFTWSCNCLDHAVVGRGAGLEHAERLDPHAALLVRACRSRHIRPRPRA